ncbi:unnamed protein product [Eruca vesicaria subsp. sativa]|uniref:Uncharacterized protein n=1 Tax=Eruca vesicaria subsp. sativa TaxID=29727 RepID=A0ABC8LRE5_ERUVS|nr:unnamed protein product [Eruca vesicaria subsp. sativa]
MEVTPSWRQDLSKSQDDEYVISLVRTQSELDYSLTRRLRKGGHGSAYFALKKRRAKGSKLTVSSWLIFEVHFVNQYRL